MNVTYCFTDGSCLHNNQSDVTKRRGGIGVFFKDNDDRNTSKSFQHNTLMTALSNQTMELQAIYEALLILFETNALQSTIIHLYTDSKYCFSILTTWAEAWQKNNWRKKDNSEIKHLYIIKKIYTMYQNIKLCTSIHINHIRAHKKSPPKDSLEYYGWYGNNQADIMAQHAANACR